MLLGQIMLVHFHEGGDLNGSRHSSAQMKLMHRFLGDILPFLSTVAQGSRR